MLLNRIVCIDHLGLDEAASAGLSQFSLEVVRYRDVPTTNEERIRRIADADAVLLSWFTTLPGEVIRACPKLRYIGMCSTQYDGDASTVDRDAAMDCGVTVTGVSDYGDEGVVEYVISELIQLLKGLKGRQWRSEPVELTGRRIGIIGMGATGQMLVDRALAFGAELSYFSRSRKPRIEARGVSYQTLDTLLRESEIISLHLPRNTTLLGDREFDLMRDGSILVSTSFGFTFEESAFARWIERPGNFAIMDGDTLGENFDRYSRFANVCLTPTTTGWTQQARHRLSQGVIQNLRDFTSGVD